MSTRANVTSVEAIEAFRAQLIVYLSKARPALEDVSSDVSRTRSWLEHDQRQHWENQVRRHKKALDQAQQDLFSAEIAKLREVTVVERLAVNKAKRALEESEAKLRTVKKWSREFGGHVEPLAKRLERLHTVLVNDLPLAAATLAEISRVLHEYLHVTTQADPGGAVPSRASIADDQSEPEVKVDGSNVSEAPVDDAGKIP